MTGSLARFDGYATAAEFDNLPEGIQHVLIDAKWNITTKSKQLRDIRRIRDAFLQNPAYLLQVEVPSDEARRRARRIFESMQFPERQLRVTVPE